MNITPLQIIILIAIVIYPFIVYYKFKTLNKRMAFHWSSIQKLLTIYKETPLEENLEKIHRERRLYNTVVRENNAKLDSFIGKRIAQKYNFKKKEHFEFTP